MASEFSFNETIRKLKASSVKPSALAKLFKLDESSLVLTDEDGACYLPEDDHFEPALADGKSYVVDGTELVASIQDKMSQMIVAVKANRDVAVIQGDKRDNLIKEIINSCKSLDESANMLYHAPQAVCLVDSLAILASAAPDPSLVTNDMPADKFNRLRTPTSFRASLYQVSANMCSAFRIADYSMNTIRASLIDLPVYFTATLEIVGQNDDQKSQKILAKTLSKIDNASQKCKIMANKAHQAFNDVLLDIDELCQASVASNSTNARELEELKKLKDEMKIQKEARENALKELESQHEEAKENAKEALKEYRDQIGNSAALGKLFLASLADGVFDTVKVAASLPVNIFKGGVNAGVERVAEYLQDHESVKCSETMKYAVESSLMQGLDKIAMDLEELDEETMNDYITSLRDYQKYSPVTKEGKELFSKAKEVRKFLEAHGTKVKNPALKNEVNNLKVSIQNLVAICVTFREEQQRIKDQKDAAKLSFFETVVKGEMEKTRSTHDHYNKESAKEGVLRKELNQNREDLTRILCKLQNIDTTSVKLTDIIEYLREGIDYMGKVKQNWEHLSHFFDNIKIIIDNNLSENVQTFVEQAKDDLSRKLMLQCALKAIGYCIQVSNCAEIYTAVSKKHVMPVISGVGEQFALTEAQARQKQQGIQANLFNVEKDVRELIEQKQEEFRDRVNEQMEVYAESLAQALTHESKKTIKN